MTAEQVKTAQRFSIKLRGMSIEIAALIKENQSNLEAVGSGLVEGKGETVVTGIMSMVLAMVTGHPEIAVLAPFLQEGVRRAFASTATRQFEKALAEMKAEDEKAAFAAKIAEPIEALIGQSLIQMVKVQHRTKDEVIDALGGLRKEFADFREQLQDRLDDAGVKIDVQRVREGATGVRISEGARASVWIKEMTVSGEGSIGIDLRK